MRPLPLLSGWRRALTNRPRAVAILAVGLALPLWAAAGYAGWVSYDVTAAVPGRDAIRGLGDMPEATTLLDAGDRPVFTIFKEQRIEVPLAAISPYLVQAVLAVEDQRFFEHRGVDAVRIAGSLVANLREGRAAQGGSTITQQLARQSFLTREKTLRRKLMEVILAAHLERAYSKEEILELYLNKVYLGDGFYGAEAAALGYFGKHASDLRLDEAALLAGLIQSPSAYAPSGNPERALARRAVVLQAMLESGAIDRSAFERGRAAPLALTNALRIDEDFGLYFKEQVRRELVERFGWPRVSEGGLRVYTTIDPELQRAAERTVEAGLRQIEARRGFKATPRAASHGFRLQAEAAAGPEQAPDYLQGALMAVDPRTGYVRAMVGGRDFHESPFNRAVQAKRQPGSAFKPFVYAAALESGFTPATLITRLDDPVLTAEGAWVPEDEHSTATAMTLRAALRTSSNRAAVQLLRSVGIPVAVSYAEKLKVGTPPSVPSLALGAGEVTLEAMTAAFGAFASGGLVRDPVLVRRVEDSDGRVLFEARDEPQRAVSETTAFLMAHMLADVLNRGTGYRARQAGFMLPAAGKTGTTNEFVDAWFVGFTPGLVTGVWIGFDRPRTIVGNGYAGDLAVPMWAEFMKTATRDDEPIWIAPPPGVVAVDICRVSGQLPSRGCASVPVANNDGGIETRSMIAPEYFARGSQPTIVCPVHPAPSLFDRFAGLFGRHGPVASEAIGLPDPPLPGPAAGTTGTPAPQPAAVPAPTRSAAEAKPEPERKRGFWSRLFGLGKKKKGG